MKIESTVSKYHICKILTGFSEAISRCKQGGVYRSNSLHISTAAWNYWSKEKGNQFAMPFCITGGKSFKF